MIQSVEKELLVKRTTMLKRTFLFSWFLLAVYCSSGQDFTATVQLNHVLLKWNMPHNKSADHYEIERRSRGGEFKTIAIILSDNQTDTASYFFKDKLAGGEGHYYYRIKTLFNDGRDDYSEILSVAIKDIQQEMIVISPDPSTGKLKLGLPLVRGSYLYRIYSMSGKLLATQRSAASNPELSSENLATGKYFMEAYHPQTGKRYYGTFVK